jgi:hypothetical protein
LIATLSNKRTQFKTSHPQGPDRQATTHFRLPFSRARPHPATSLAAVLRSFVVWHWPSIARSQLPRTSVAEIARATRRFLLLIVVQAQRSTAQHRASPQHSQPLESQNLIEFFRRARCASRKLSLARRLLSIDRVDRAATLGDFSSHPPSDSINRYAPCRSPC